MFKASKGNNENTYPNTKEIIFAIMSMETNDNSQIVPATIPRVSPKAKPEKQEYVIPYASLRNTSGVTFSRTKLSEYTSSIIEFCS